MNALPGLSRTSVSSVKRISAPFGYLRFALQITLLLLVCLCAAVPMQGRAKEHYGDGFVTVINHPASDVVDLVRAVAADGIIRGTSEYQGSTELYGAEPLKDSDAFSKWTGGGTIIYKERSNTLAPSHFYGSNDQGTVVVRYVVQPNGANSCTLRIDAIFEEDSHHNHHPSDGQVEASEFEAVIQKVKDLEDLEKKRHQEEVREQMEKQVQDLEAQLDQEKAHLADLNAKAAGLEQAVQRAQGNKLGRIKTDSADLKAGPYTESTTLKTLDRGDPITVLLQTPHWFQVRTGQGQDGWVYRLLVEVGP